MIQTLNNQTVSNKHKWNYWIDPQ